MNSNLILTALLKFKLNKTKNAWFHKTFLANFCFNLNPWQLLKNNQANIISKHLKKIKVKAINKTTR